MMGDKQFRKGPKRKGKHVLFQTYIHNLAQHKGPNVIWDLYMCMSDFKTWSRDL